MKNSPMQLLILPLALLLPACQSPKTKALRSVDRIVEHAIAAQEDAVEVRPWVQDEGVPKFESMTGHLSSITDEALSEAKPNIQELKNPETWIGRVVSWFKGVLFWVAIALAAILGLFVLGELRLIPGLGAILSWLASTSG